MKVAIFQAEQKDFPSVESNIRLIEELCIEYSQNDVAIILFSELFLTGYSIGKERIHQLAESRDGPSFQKIASLASFYNIGIVYGYPEREGRNVFNSLMFIGKDGKLVTHYQKTHLWSDYEKQIFQSGENLVPPVPFQGFNVALLICYDIEFPEITRVLCLQGCDFLLISSANGSHFVSEVIVKARCHENHVFAAYCNRVGHEGDFQFSGKSGIFSPTGEELLRFTDSPMRQTAFREIVPTPEHEHHRQINPYYQDRRPDLYSILSSISQ